MPGTPSSKADSERKRGPGRPPGSTKQTNIEKAQQLHEPLKAPKDGSSSAKKAKQDFEVGPPMLTSNLPASQEKAKLYNIDVVTNNPLKWSVTQVCMVALLDYLFILHKITSLPHKITVFWQNMLKLKSWLFSILKLWSLRRCATSSRACPGAQTTWRTSSCRRSTARP